MSRKGATAVSSKMMVFLVNFLSFQSSTFSWPNDLGQTSKKTRHPQERKRQSNAVPPLRWCPTPHICTTRWKKQSLIVRRVIFPSGSSSQRANKKNAKAKCENFLLPIFQFVKYKGIERLDMGLNDCLETHTDSYMPIKKNI
jgi:hypothetical protein